MTRSLLHRPSGSSASPAASTHRLYSDLILHGGDEALMLAGGGRITGGMLRAGLVDEVSLLVVPVADGRVAPPSLVDVEGDDVRPWRLALQGVARRTSGVRWRRYRVEPRRDEA